MDTEHNIKNKSRPKNNIIDFIRLADIISIGNILSGLASIFSSINGNFKIASVFLFLAVIFDYYDGKTARKTNTENDFGKQIDSLCDITSFIIAPVIFAYSIGLQDPIHMIIYSIYTATGVLRLARYNITGTLENGKYFEGLPVSILEAMACRKPVVATQHRGCEDIVVQGETGWLVPKRDAAALAKALLCCIMDKPMCERLGQAGRQRVESDYELDRCTRLIADVIEKACVI